MRRRILAMLLAFALVLAYTPGMALATETEQGEAVAQIGETTYTSLAEAVAAGGEINLLQDVTLGEVILIDKAVTINGNGHTVTSSANRIFRVTASGAYVQMDNLIMNSTASRTGNEDIRGISVDMGLNAVVLTLNNCTVDFDDTYGADWAYAVNVCDGCSDIQLTINGGTYEGANVINVYGDAHVINISDATLSSLYEYNETYCGAGVMLYGEGCALDLSNTTITGNHAVAVRETVAGGNTIDAGIIDTTNISVKTAEDLIGAVAYGGTIKLLDDITLTETIEIDKDIIIIGDGHSITSSANRIFRVTKEMAVVTMEYVNLISTAKRSDSADVRGISIDSGLEGVQLTLVSSNVKFTEPYGEDWAYAVNVCDGCTDVTIKILGGTYEGANVINLWGDGHSVTIDGAVLNSLYVDSEEWHGAGIALEGENVHLIVSNTVFNGTNAKAILAKNEDTHTIEESNNTDNTKLYEKPSPYVAEYDGKQYETLAEAVDAVPADAVLAEIVLLKDVVLEDALTIDKSLHLELNGYTLSRVGTQATDCALIIANSDVAITNSSAADTGKVAATGAGIGIYVQKDAMVSVSCCVEGADLGAEIHGCLTLNAGSIGGTNADADGAYVYNEGGTNGQLTVSRGALIDGGEEGTAIVMHKDTVVYTEGLQICKQAFRIYGGELFFNGSTMGTNGILVTTDHADPSLVGNASVTVAGGITAGSESYAVYVENPANIENYTATVEITTDMFIEGQIGYGENVNSGIRITGGCYYELPSEFLADGYIASFNGTWYTVEAKKVSSNGVVAGDSVGNVTAEVEGIDGDVVSTVVNSNTSTGEALAAEARKVEVTEEKTTEYKKDAVETLKLEETAEVSLEIRPYLDVEIKNYTETTEGDETVKTMTVEIDALYDIVAVAEKKEMVVAEAQPLEDVQEPVSITVPIPDAFLDAPYIYVRHIKDNATEYTYTATVDKTAKTATFLNPNGFSTFELYTSQTLVDTDDPTDEPEVLAKFVATSMILEEAIDIRFWIPKGDLGNVDGAYAVITLTTAKGEVRFSGNISSADWDGTSDTYYKIRFNNVAAKEMCDTITVNVYNKAGKPIAETLEYTLGKAIVAMYKSNSNDQDIKELAVAMLNYGAAAQKAFDYNEENLATQYLNDLI